MKIETDMEALVADEPKQSDMFGPIPTRRQRRRGWTELDKLRQRLVRLERKVADGDYTEKDMSALAKTWEILGERYVEASEKWAKAFGR